ncbi:MAG TPA: 3-hydroxyacyl-CoA dehydrogenase [Solirubrobacteraceae bacterium]|nr:3-hydroxyacyl-CoA dehydrogenase [Solirubrobacteraceae bacterium]
MQIDDVRRVAVVGAGTMGQQIAFQCAAHGYDVTIYDVDASALEAAKPRIDAYAESLETGGAITPELRASAQGRLTLTPDLPTAAADADLLSEAIYEDPDLKGRVLAECNAACPDRTIFMTNTSMLLPSQFAEASGRPGRLLALHFHPPVWINNLADVMPHPGTAPEATQLVVAFARRIGQVPIELHREHNGYVFNSMYSALNRAAITLAQQGVASIEDIDRSWMHVTKAPVGPLGALDAVGLDTAWWITDYWARQLGDEELVANAAFLKAYVDRGDVGVKSGRGFYTYPDPAYARPGFVEGSEERG